MGRIIRVTLSHNIEGSKVISDPEGWKDALIGYERHPEFHCVVEFYKSSFSAYGSNGVEDGGRDWLKNIEQTHGPDEIISALVESSDGMEPFEELFFGTMPISAMVEVADFDHTLQLTFDSKGFWKTFLSRFDTPVDINSATDLDGNAKGPSLSQGILLSPQVLRQTTELEQSKFWDFGYNDYFPSPDYNQELRVYDAANDRYFISFDLANAVIDEVEKRFSPEYGESVDLPKALFIATYAGEYDINCDLFFTGKMRPSIAGGFYTKNRLKYDDLKAGGSPGSLLEVYIKIGNAPEIAFTKTFYSNANPDQIIDGLDEYVKYSYADVITVEAGTPIRIYGKNTGSGSFGAGNNSAFIDVYQLVLLGDDNSGIEWPYNPIGGDLQFYGSNTKSFLSIVADTIFPSPIQKDGILVHDLGMAVCERITGVENSFYSEYYGRSDFGSRLYAEDGCGSGRAVIKGLHLRGYYMSQKPFFQSMRDYWSGLNPIDNVGLKADVIDGIDTIVMEESREFYPSNVSIQLSNVRNIKKSHDNEHYINQVQVGYEKWGRENVSGLDDPQTKRTWASRFKNVGRKLQLLSTWISAGLTIEGTRRNTILKSADDKFDNENFIISVRNNGFFFVPELDENYSSVTGIRSPETRYNLNLTPARNLVRWMNYVSGGLQNYLSSVLKFVSGEGNYDMSSTRNDGGCSGDFDGAGLSEKQDMPISEDFLFIPILYEIDHYLTYEQQKALKTNPEWAIEVSQTESNYIKFYLKSAEYNPYTGTFRFTGWPKEYFNITSVSTVAAEVDPYTRIFDYTFGTQFQ